MAEAAHRQLGLDFQKHYDIAFHHGIFVKTRRMFLMGYIMDIFGRGRTFVVWWLDLIPPATLADVCAAVRAEFHRDEPQWIAFGRGLRPAQKELRFYRPHIIERTCATVSSTSRST